MDQLSSCAYIMDVYGLCGASILTDFANVTLSQHLKGTSQLDKLVIAKQIAEGLASVHDIDRAGNTSLVHNDINMANVVIGRNGIPQINDFNIAVFLMKHNKTGKTCGFPSHFSNPQVCD